MPFHLRAATDQDRLFARALAEGTMSRYYAQYGFVWSNQEFDAAWAVRDNWLICRDENVIGFISLSYDSEALFIRELHLVDGSRGLGVGTWVLEQMVLKANASGLLRLTVFKSNPARMLYERMGLSIVGEESCFWRMERTCHSS